MVEAGVIAAVLGCAVLVWIVHRANVRAREEALRLRRENLIAKYSSTEIADAIIAQKIWQGMSSEQLADSWGQPVDIDEKVYKTKTKETWKYGVMGRNRYHQRVYVENRIVVGWQNQ